MTDYPKTIADFIEVRRARANKIESAAGGMPNQFQRELIAGLRDEADRLEAAWKCEVDALTAKLDEARHCWKVWSDRADELLTMCNEQYAKLKIVGDAAKLREALEVLLNAMCSCDDHLPPVIREGELREAYRKAESALSAPPRNCDVGTAEEQTQRFRAFSLNNSSAIIGMCDSKCPCIDSGDKCHCLTKWAQMPYEEGGDK